MLPEAHERVCIETAIIEKLSAYLILARQCGLWVNSLQIRGHRHAAVLHTNQPVIAKISRDGGQHALDAPAALLRRMIVMSPSNGQEIDDALINGEQGRC